MDLNETNTVGVQNFGEPSAVMNLLRQLQRW